MRVPQGDFELTRNPPDNRLQAWDAADENLLNHLDELGLSDDSRILVLNDSFGALGVALAGQSVFSWSDSLLAQQALRANLDSNGYAPDQVRVNSDIDFPAEKFDLVLIKTPKALALLEHQLYAIRDLLEPDCRILAAGMAKHIHRSTLDCFESILGPSTTSKARKKARLIFIERDRNRNQGQGRFPESYQLEVNRVFSLINHASLFSRDRLDPGTRLLLENLPVTEGSLRVVDLGCGNGVVGVIAAELNPEACLLFCDESHMAIASARENFTRAHGGDREAEFRLVDCLDGVETESQDLILLNPPFHQQHRVGDAVAWRMFRQARSVLSREGELRVVGNRHLGYHAKLKKLFGNCELVTGNNKFVVLSSTKT